MLAIVERGFEPVDSTPELQLELGLRDVLSSDYDDGGGNEA